MPKTTPGLPYIEFRINNRGRIKLSVTSSWYGGITAGFSCSNGDEGNTCKPKDLDKYINAFKKRKIKSIEKRIKALQKQLETLTEITKEKV